MDHNLLEIGAILKLPSPHKKYHKKYVGVISEKITITYNISWRGGANNLVFVIFVSSFSPFISKIFIWEFKANQRILSQTR